MCPKGNQVIPSGPCKENTCIVVVTWHPDADLAIRVGNVRNTVSGLILVDNGSPGPCVKALRKLAAELECHLIENQENKGIATALNQSVTAAIALGFSWVLMLDQDSMPFSNILEILGSVFSEHPIKLKVAMIGANYLQQDGALAYAHSERNFGTKNFQEVGAVITAGCLLATNAFTRVGPFNDAFFIDSVDNDYCLRARAKGYVVLLSRDPAMQHAIGSQIVCRIFGKRLVASNHSARRRYYMTRNVVVLSKDHLFTEPRWVLGNLFGFAKSLVTMLLLETNRGEKLRSVLQGLYDGVRGRLGPR